MGRIALLLGGFLLLATPAQAGLMDLLESIESPLQESPEPVSYTHLTLPTILLV